MELREYLYIAIAVTLGFGLLILIRWLLRRIEQARFQASHEDDYSHAVPTESPLERPEKKAKAVRQKSLRFRFSIIRHLATLGVVLLVTIAITLPLLDRIPAALLSVLIASSGVVIGIAARPFIENLIAGIVITFARHLRIGDTVEIDGHYGTIEDITPINTVVKAWDWRRYIIPNARMLSKEFVSLTLNDSFRWVYVEFWVAPETDLEQLRRTAVELASGCEHFAGYEEPGFWVMELGEQATRCWLAAWADAPGDAWLLASEMRTGLAEQLQLLGIGRHSFRVSWQREDLAARRHGFTPQPAGEGR